MRYGPNPRHHLGRPFLTAYQLAIEYDRRFPELGRQLGLTTGGKGSGWPSSLPQQLARELSQRIKSGEIQDIEGGFLSTCNVNDLSFRSPSEIIRPSVKDISVFRLIVDEVHS